MINKGANPKNLIIKAHGARSEDEKLGDFVEITSLD